jgi:hypothetical protein
MSPQAEAWLRVGTIPVVESLLALIAAAVASWFAIELFVSFRQRPRLHAEIWALAFAAYAIATWALMVGLAIGWTSLSFRIFYFFGAIANIPLLAAGSMALANERAGRVAMRVVTLWIMFGFFATFLAPFTSVLPAATVPEGSEVFDFTFAIEALTLPGPRWFAAVSGAVGSIVVISLAVVTTIRTWSTNRRLAHGNVLIVLGVLAPALGGSLTALGESAALTVSLVAGSTLLWFGYRMASGARASHRLGDGAALPGESENSE